MAVTEYRCYSDGFWQISGIAMVTYSYLTSALNYTVGDIETALENIIAKYGLGGDAV
jgi:hypothetical protein